MIFKLVEYSNIPCISITLLVFHFDISSSDCNKEQLEKILFIFVISLIFHLEISDKDSNFLLSKNKNAMSSTLSLSNFDISDISYIFEQAPKIPFISVKFFVLHFEISIVMISMMFIH